MLIAGLLLALLIHGNFVYLIMLDFYSGRVIFVNKKHMNITVEGCATPRLTLGLYTPMKVSFDFLLLYFRKEYGNETLWRQGEEERTMLPYKM